MPYLNPLPNYTLSFYITEVYPTLIHYRARFSDSIKSQQLTQASYLGRAVRIIGAGGVAREKSVNFFFEKV